MDSEKCRKLFRQFNGITAEEYPEKARVLFEEMDLKWDLEQLEKV